MARSGCRPNVLRGKLSNLVAASAAIDSGEGANMKPLQQQHKDRENPDPKPEQEKPQPQAKDREDDVEKGPDSNNEDQQSNAPREDKE